MFQLVDKVIKSGFIDKLFLKKCEWNLDDVVQALNRST
ncbi:hypothetical protein CHCC20375_2551 [Bacillus licheniformis]|nr:hypothetical protein CHCC20375_2551 [Bacillus licheniformis]